MADHASLQERSRERAQPDAGTSAHLDLYGLGVSIHGDWAQVTEDLKLDFAWFERPALDAAPDIEVVIECRPPDYDAVGDLSATFVTPRNVVYEDGPRAVIDYFGQALSVLDREAGRLVIQGEQEHVVHQAAYLFLLSRAGEFLERRWLPRLHGLGLAGSSGGVVVMLPSGGGKTSLALQALDSDQVQLLSEDSPLIDRHGRVHPFPLRIGLHPGEAETHGEQGLREIERLEFSPKVALEVETFADRIATSPVPMRHLVIGRRTLGRVARLSEAPRRAAIGPLLREAVVGVGLYQGMEFVLQRGMRDVLGHGGIAMRRALCCAAVLRRAKIWHLETGRDRDRNWAALEPLL